MRATTALGPRSARAIMAEFILCAAIYVDDGQTTPRRGSHAYPKTGLMFCGWRHADCFTTMTAWGELLTPGQRAACNLRDRARVMGQPPPEERPDGLVRDEKITEDQYYAMRRDIRGFDQGFLTSTGRYVNRAEAYAIAEVSGQLRRGPQVSRELDSEDLYE